MEAQKEMPRYKSHKTVWALKIADLKTTTIGNNESDGSMWMVPEDSRYAPIRIDFEYMRKHKPAVGGYYVVYADGYKSFSPAKAFEDGNTLIERGTDNSVEQDIQAAGKTAPRVTPAALQANIASHWFFTAAEGVEGAAAAGTPHAEQPPVSANSPLRLLTFCVLVLKNGFTVTGESACASPENYDEDIGRKIARQNAEQKIWPLMGYQLKEQLFQRTQPACAPE